MTRTKRNNFLFDRIMKRNRIICTGEDTYERIRNINDLSREKVRDRRRCGIEIRIRIRKRLKMLREEIIEEVRNKLGIGRTGDISGV